MTRIGRYFLLVAALLATVSLEAQTNGSNSSYSRFGLGTLADQSLGQNRAMGGVAQGLRNATQVNLQNPASYSATDSLTFIFDAGMGVQAGHLSNGQTSSNVTNATLDYIVAALRMRRGLGLSFGFVPYSTIGYSFSETRPVGTNYTTGKAITSETVYYGNGGLHQLYLGVGWTPVADLSIGANIAYLWGDYDHSLAQTFKEGGTATSAYNAQNEVWSSDMKTWRMDIGLQYPIQLNRRNSLTLGATLGLGHKVGSEVELVRYTSQGDSITSKATDAFEMPYTLSAGATWQYEDRLTLGADYALQKWEGCRIPTANSTAAATEVAIVTDQYSNQHRLALGADYRHDPYGRYLQRMHFRLGAAYSTPYVRVNGRQGPSEIRLTAGVALPMKTGSRSLVNISAEWLKRNPSTSAQIRENYFLLHLGITFNEAWFMKRRFQ